MLVFLSKTLFLLSGSLCGASVVDPVPTFDHRDPVTEEILKCPKCPPGTFMSAHCTATTPTQCQPCKNGHFTDLWNYMPRCLYCNNLCTGNLEVETECSPTTNRICRCKEGFYSADDFCIRHTECGPGYGVQTKGTQGDLVGSEKFQSITLLCVTNGVLGNCSPTCSQIINKLLPCSFGPIHHQHLIK
uniref:TNFR-Cys domain-containing protein n=1 Tax=Neolamprologus brichardi TaxID=32507 RepID=A0A3Q4I760_NEOBR